MDYIFNNVTITLLYLFQEQIDNLAWNINKLMCDSETRL